MKQLFNNIRYFIETIRQPKTLKLSPDQAEYVQHLFLSGSRPEDIGRAMDKTYGRLQFDYFKTPNEDRTALVFAPADYEIDGLEYVRAAMIRLGALTPKRDGDYYTVAHPMTQRIAAAMSQAAIPISRQEAPHG